VLSANKKTARGRSLCSPEGIAVRWLRRLVDTSAQRCKRNACGDQQALRSRQAIDAGANDFHGSGCARAIDLPNGGKLLTRR
jgi:hypothetical protein